MIRVYPDLEQGSPEWFAVRLGIPTASCFADVISKGRGSAPSKTRQTYLLKLAGERLTGELEPGFSNEHTERGKVMEDEARDLYCFRTGTDVQRVGFVMNEVLRAGCSPDGLIGVDGMSEVKTKLPKLQLAVLESGEVPEDHVAQCQGGLLVTGRQWIDFISYWPGLPIFIKRLYRDEDYIASLRVGLDDFNNDLDAIVRKYQ